MASTNKRTRRTPEELIKDLEAKIALVKVRAEQRKAKKDPTLRHVSAALRSIDKALGEAQDAAAKTVLSEARASLSAVLSLDSASKSPGRGVLVQQSHQSGKIDLTAVVGYLSLHPGSRSEDIAAGFGTDTKAIRPALQKLKTGGRVKTKGKARAMRYYVGAGK